MFGGKTQEGRRLGDVWAMNTTSWTWRHVPSIGSAPSPRFGAAVGMWGPQLVVFGGNSASGLLNDVWTLDIDEHEVRAACHQRMNNVVYELLVGRLWAWGALSWWCLEASLQVVC